MKLSPEQHSALAKALHKDAAEASLTLEQKRALQAKAKRFEALAKRAKELETASQT